MRNTEALRCKENPCDSGSALDFHRLVEYARSWKESALVQRLGFFLDLHQVELPKEIRAALKELVKPNNKIYLVPRGRWNVPARLNPEWIVVENVPKNVLAENVEGRRPFVPRNKGAVASAVDGGRK